MAKVELTNLNIKFPLGSKPMKRVIVDALSRKKSDYIASSYHALKDINLELNDGDRLAILGKNGAGKTTLLKTLAGIYEPFTGNIRTEGEVTTLMNVTAGMEIHLSGIENIQVKGAFLGLSSDKIAEIQQDIIEFADLGDFIHLPVKKYSSGMMVRLAFAISTAVPMEILLLDEWLSAGDIDFVQKSEQRMNEVVSGSSILVFASHSMDMLKTWCNRAILLKEGAILESFSDMDEAVQAYIES